VIVRVNDRTRRRLGITIASSLLFLVAVAGWGIAATSIRQTHMTSLQIAAGNVYYVSPSGSDANPGTATQPLQTIDRAVSLSEPGGQVLLLPGTYNQLTTITTSGAPERPITIRSASADPDQYAVIDRQMEPAWGGVCAFLIKGGASWITIENLKFRRCWQDIIALDDASYITVRGINAQGGTNVVDSMINNNHHILIEDSYWEQDKRIWTEWGYWEKGWDELHNSYYNGGIYGGTSGGGIVIRNNVVRYVFNGMRWVSKGPYDNPNAEIYGNVWEDNLDNAVEPEVGAFNLHIYHNIFHNIPLGVLSHDDTHGGDVYFYGNVGWLDDEGPPNVRSWTIYKLNNGSGSLHIYHNSFYYRRALSDDEPPPNVFLRHYNNAYYHITKDMGPETDWVKYGADHEYDNDCSSAPWNDVITERGQEKHGLENTDPQFVDPLHGDLRLQPTSPCRDRGRVIPGFTQGYEGAAPDIGAYEGDKLVEGPPFETQIPPNGLHYQEEPRITRHYAKGSELQLFFSWPLDPATVSKEAIHLLADGAEVVVTGVGMGASNREVVVQTATVLEGAKLQLRLNPLPVGENGEPATMWASTIDPIRH
jgi:hypothetical protein